MKQRKEQMVSIISDSLMHTYVILYNRKVLQ
jgi:hypothetical protein